MGQQELRVSVDNGGWCNKRQRKMVKRQMVSKADKSAALVIALSVTLELEL
jgi:hypothetical protein